MKYSLTVPQSSLDALSASVLFKFLAVKPVVELAMAERFRKMVLANFGIAGADRPTDWPPLSWSYALKVGRSIATLEVSGALKGAVKAGHDGDAGFCSVSNADVPYAMGHQFGSNRLPARPYFPVDADGEVMPYTQSQVQEAAERALFRALGGGL